jgi:hypothetical protein
MITNSRLRVDLNSENAKLSDLQGKVIKSVVGLSKDSEGVVVSTECGDQYLFYHEQCCCEQVWLADFEGDPYDLAGGTVLTAEESSNTGVRQYGDTYTWTFYKIETTRGSLWMRWNGESNGYYSERVDFVLLNEGVDYNDLFT